MVSLSLHLKGSFWMAAALALAAGLLIGPESHAGAEAGDNTAVEARILVVKRGPVLSGKGIEEDFMATHLALVRSPLIVEAALRRPELAKLASLTKAKDPVAAILARLEATHAIAPGGGAHILVLTLRGASADDGRAILSGVIAAYQEFIERTYSSPSEQTLELLTKARDLLHKDLAQAEERYLKFRQDSPVLFTNAAGVNFEAERLAILQRRRTELLIRRTEAQLAVHAAARDADRPGLVLEAHAWAASGFDKLPKAMQDRGVVPLYRDHLMHQLDELTAASEAIDQLIARERNRQKELVAFEHEEKQQRDVVVRTQLLYDAAVKRLQGVTLARDASGFDTRVISPPSTVKLLAGRSNGDPPADESNQARVELELRRLLATHGDHHPEVIRLKEMLGAGRTPSFKGQVLVLTKTATSSTTLKDVRVLPLGSRSFLVGTEVKSNVTRGNFIGSRVWIPIDDVTQLVELGDAGLEKK
jgi:hypothetical protein